MMFRIREAREQCGLTQAALAEKLGVNGVTLSGYETGKHDPKSDTLVKIAQICGVSVDFLLDREKPAPKTVSDKAMEIARAYDQMSSYGKSLIDKIVENEGKYKIMKVVPMIGEAILDGTVETKEAAKKEQRELAREENALNPEKI